MGRVAPAAGRETATASHAIDWICPATLVLINMLMHGCICVDGKFYVMTCQHALCITLGVGKILHPGNGLEMWACDTEA